MQKKKIKEGMGEELKPNFFFKHFSIILSLFNLS